MNDKPPPIPTSFWGYLRSFGPGLVVVLTWLGAGDIVEMAVAGTSYGYSLMWVLVVAVLMRYLFVSLIAKYQLCNPHNESVLDGLVRLHPFFAPMLFGAAIVMGHIYGSYMTKGIAEATHIIVGWGPIWFWGIVGNGLALVLVFRPAYQMVETLFKWLLALLSVAFLSTAIQMQPNLADIGKGLTSFEVPAQENHKYGAMLLVVGMVGAIGGSLMNLVYPYFIESKKWQGPQYRKLQLYDFLLAVVVMIILNLAIWVLGAEAGFGTGLKVEEMGDLQSLLGNNLGTFTQKLFFCGIFGVVFTSLVGHALGLAYMGSHALVRMNGKLRDGTEKDSFAYRAIVVWCLISPIIWTVPGMPGFVTLTLVSNALQVLLLPIIAFGLLMITANSRFIGERYKNRWWENGLMVAMLCLAVWSAYKAVASVAATFSP